MRNDFKFFLKLMAVSFALFIALVVYCGCKDSQPVKQPVKVEYFKAGDILEPDYAIPERLIVVDAAGLNKDVALIEQGMIEATDGEIAAVFYKHCKPY